MSAIIGFAALVVLALAGWAIAEGKNKALTYNNNEEEEAILEQGRQQVKDNGFSELGIKDVIRTIATTGYSAV
jgi:hypothetical protein